jgi:ethanolamine-phosphate cytidylyltransferase
MYAAHGDDYSINSDGQDAFGILKRVGRCKTFKRTEGVSSTSIVGKLLLMTRDTWESVDEPTAASALESKPFANMLTTSRRISEFSNRKAPRPGDRIIYIDGIFDLFRKV